jgi:8-oxo-dGTP pyrophosphatase MutT (NUDIX family)
MNYAIAFLYSGNSVLLVRRCNATYGNCSYSLVGGKIEPGESGVPALIREVKEEVGITLAEKDLEFVHVIHRKGTESEFIALCFKADITDKPFTNLEPEKHDDVQLFALDNLPTNILPAHKQIIEAIAKKQLYSEHGW